MAKPPDPRWKKAYELRQTGLTYEAIRQNLGLSNRERARQLADRGRRYYAINEERRENQECDD